MSGETLDALDKLKNLISNGLIDEKKGGVSKSVDMLKEQTRAGGGKGSAASQYFYQDDIGKEKPAVSQSFILKKQFTFAGSHNAIISHNGYLLDQIQKYIPIKLSYVMNLQLYPRTMKTNKMIMTQIFWILKLALR